MKRAIGGILLAVCLFFSGCRTPGLEEFLTSDPAASQTDASAVSTGPASTDATGEAPQTGTAGTGGTSTVSSGTQQTDPTQGTTPATSPESTPPTQKPTDPVQPPADTAEEMRGVWLSYIELNALFKANSTPDAAKKALDQVMDNCVSYGLNTVFFHVRANSDAYYPSSIFKPAASVQKLLDAGFDPLAYAVEAAHARGLELHAWVNPYRIGRDLSYRVGNCAYFAEERSGGASVYWYAPTSQEVQALILNGVRELVNGYAIDGVQYDDYFYPKGVLSAHEPADFEQEDYAATGGHMSVADWRRVNVDALISGSYRAVHTRPGCVFGVSPSHKFTENREERYADTVKWLENSGYVDYLCPQVYFGFEHQTSAFDKIVSQWTAFTPAAGVKLYIGIGIYKTGLENDQYAGTGKAEWAQNGDIMKRSVEYVRAQSKCGGMLFYSYTFFDPGTARDGPYKQDIAAREVENLLPLLRQDG